MEAILLPTAPFSPSLSTVPVPANAAPPVFVDISSALSFSDSQRLLAAWLKLNPASLLDTAQVALDCGSLVLTGKMLSKLLETLRQQGLSVTMVYARLSQTQQAALSCGLGVKEYPPANGEGLSSDGYVSSPLVMVPKVLPETPRTGEEDILADRLSEVIESPSVDPVLERVLDDEVNALPLPVLAEELVALQTTTIFNSKPFQVSSSTDSIEPLPVLMPLVSLNSDAPKSLSERGASDAVVVEKPECLEAPTVTHYQATAADTLVPVPVTGAEAMPTRLVTGTLRSGQTVVSEGHLLVMGDVHSGSEIIARGHIVVWGELRGVAHAGAVLKAGDTPQQWASIRALLLRAVQLRIGTTIARRPDRTSNHKPESPTDRAWHPEFARMVDGEIRIQADLNPGHSIDFF